LTPRESLVIPVVPNLDIQQINQVNQETPSGRLVPLPQVPLPRQTTTSSEEEQLLRTPGNPLYCYYPESIYVADHIPTRKPRELESFKNHCHLQYNTYRLPLEINHPIENI